MRTSGGIHTRELPWDWGVRDEIINGELDFTQNDYFKTLV